VRDRFVNLAPAIVVLIAGCNGTSPVQPAIDSTPVEYRADKESAIGVVYRPAGAVPLPGLIVVHGDTGVTEWTKNQARRLAELGYVVLAVDLYRGQVVPDVVDAHIMDRALPEERMLGDLKSAVNYLTGRPDVVADAIGIIGWDSGGGYALDAALHDPRLRTVVICYGRVATEAKTLEPLQGSVLGIFAGKDEGIPPETIEQFRRAMQQAGKRLAGIHIYPDCPNGFMNPASGMSRPEAVRDAWEKIEHHLAVELKR
jgi:carboxymethylenebutenolidase